jgi:hypothetical protein
MHSLVNPFKHPTAKAMMFAVVTLLTCTAEAQSACAASFDMQDSSCPYLGPGHGGSTSCPSVQSASFPND